MGNIISRTSTATKVQFEELGARLQASDAAIIAKERELAAKSNELESGNKEHIKLSDEANALRKMIEDLDNERRAGQKEKQQLEAELQLRNADRQA